MKRSHLVYLQLTFSLFLCSGAVIPLLKDGGARIEGADFYQQYSGFLNLLPYASIAVTFFLLAICRSHYRDIFSKHRLDIFLLFTFCVISSFDSIFPLPSFGLLVNITNLFFIASLSARYLKFNDVATLLLHMSLAIAVSSIVVSVFVPTYGISIGQHSGAWQGVFNHKNSLGIFCIFSFSAAAASLVVGNFRAASCVLLACSAFLAVMSNSATSQAIILLLSVGMALIKINVKLASKVQLIFVTSCLIFGLFFIFIFDQFLKINLTNRDGTFSKRDQIWYFVQHEILQLPYFGHGLQQFSANTLNDDFYSRLTVGFSVLSTHNGFFDILYSLGMFGYIAFSAIIIRIAYSITDNYVSPFFLLTIGGGLLAGYSESILIGTNLFTAYMFTFYCFSLRGGIRR
jgi:hypothetical protein